MSGNEAPRVLHELATETDKMLKAAQQRKAELTEVPEEIREFVREELEWIASELCKKHGYTPAQARRLIREMLTVSV